MSTITAAVDAGTSALKKGIPLTVGETKNANAAIQEMKNAAKPEMDSFVKSEKVVDDTIINEAVDAAKAEGVILTKPGLIKRLKGGVGCHLERFKNVDANAIKPLESTPEKVVLNIGDSHTITFTKEADDFKVSFTYGGELSGKSAENLTVKAGNIPENLKVELEKAGYLKSADETAPVATTATKADDTSSNPTPPQNEAGDAAAGDGIQPGKSIDSIQETPPAPAEAKAT